jgi:transcriptional regulator with XRE-family HTH domain
MIEDGIGRTAEESNPGNRRGSGPFDDGVVTADRRLQTGRLGRFGGTMPKPDLDEAGIVRARNRQVTLIGKRIRDLRRNKLSLNQLADLSQVSGGLLSRLEHGIGNPSITSLNAIARALGVDVNLFFEYQDNASAPVSRESRIYVRRLDSAMEFELLMPNLGTSEDASIVAALLSLPVSFQQNPPKQGVNNGQVHDQFEYVYRGRVTYHVDHEVHELQTGDSIVFDATKSHWRENISPTETAGILLICSRMDFI